MRARALQVFLPCFNTAEWSVLLGKPSFVLIRRPARAHFLHWSLPLYWHEALLYPLNEILILLSELHPALRHMWITVERAFWCDTRETISTRSCRNHIYDLQQISSESRENILLFHIENWYISSKSIWFSASVEMSCYEIVDIVENYDPNKQSANGINSKRLKFPCIFRLLFLVSQGKLFTK